MAIIPVAVFGYLLVDTLVRIAAHSSEDYVVAFLLVFLMIVLTPLRLPEAWRQVQLARDPAATGNPSLLSGSRFAIRWGLYVSVFCLGLFLIFAFAWFVAGEVLRGLVSAGIALLIAFPFLIDLRHARRFQAAGIAFLILGLPWVVALVQSLRRNEQSGINGAVVLWLGFTAAGVILIVVAAIIEK